MKWTIVNTYAVTFVLFASSFFLPTHVQTATINVNSGTGTWSNAQKSGGGLSSNIFGVGTNTIHWDFSASGLNNSGYQFLGNAPPALVNVLLDAPFAIGTFTHFNYPITGNALASVDLAANVMLNINGTPTISNETYHFLHDVTPNTGPGCCNDIVTFQNNVSQSGMINSGGVDYIIGLIGLKLSANGPLLQQISTIEYQHNVATLFAQIAKAEVFVPKPSTYLALGSLLTAGVLTARLRKRQKTIV